AVLHRGQASLVDQVDLNLEPHLPRLGVEPGVAQHSREYVQAAAHLLAVGAPVLLADRNRRDIPAHRSPPPSLTGAAAGAAPTLARQVACDQGRSGPDLAGAATASTPPGATLLGQRGGLGSG